MCTYMFKKSLGEKMINNVELTEIINYYGYDPFETIENFIFREVIPKYGCLTTVHRSNFDEWGFPTIDFYIRYNVKLSFEDEEKLDAKVRDDIRTFCKNNGLCEAYRKCTIFVTVSGDVYG